MSRKLVIHIGAQKCASSSLQASLDLLAEAVKDNFGFCHLKPEPLRMASQALGRNEDSAFDYLDEVLAFQASSQVVISHEMLGNRPGLVSAIAGRALVKHDFDCVVISGYSRLQSSFHVSEFCQWGFRGRAKLYADRDVFLANKLNWRKFTALERSLFAFSLGGADRDWFTDYQALGDGVNGFGGAVSVVSCHIPTRSRPYALLEHFLSSTGLSISLENFDSFDVRKNVAFHPVLIHAISTHLAELQPQQQSFFPGPHEGNDWLFRVCRRLPKRVSLLASRFDLLFPPLLREVLIGHLDSRSFAANQQYCDLMSVDIGYFKPSQGVQVLSKEELLAVACEASETRNLEDIQQFNREIENECMQAIRAEIVAA